ncbi:hypothetical protein [Flavobacterium agrisoli]|uniref:Uncharacterized protein n=1 Tax=Flavobacterium agrisoli TaxID=2793066 RepID=A0A934UIA9_9FLAO|nr:hypothetical protein [Flavobacterium agrisoli]MBK0368656.1 hypothetical protein [Flavobacterium agrisoli]
MEKNTTYEFFICRCWKCKRFEHGANTDTWEDLEIKHYNFKNSNVGNFKAVEKEFTNKLEKVKGHLDKAYNKLIATAVRKNIDPAVINQFTTSRALVAASSEPQDIFDILKTAFPLMNDNKL